MNTVLWIVVSRLASASAEKSVIVSESVCANLRTLLAVWPRCVEGTTLVIAIKSVQYASQRNECSTQRVQRNKVFYCNRVLETRAHLSRRIPHLVSELPVEIYAERQRSVWAERLEASLGSEERR